MKLIGIPNHKISVNFDSVTFITQKILDKKYLPKKYLLTLHFSLFHKLKLKLTQEEMNKLCGSLYPAKVEIKSNYFSLKDIKGGKV